MRKGYVAASFDIQQDASQAGCCVVCWEMLHATEYGGLVHVFHVFLPRAKLLSCSFAPGSYVQEWLHAPVGDDSVESCP